MERAAGPLQGAALPGGGPAVRAQAVARAARAAVQGARACCALQHARACCACPSHCRVCVSCFARAAQACPCSQPGAHERRHAAGPRCRRQRRGRLSARAQVFDSRAFALGGAHSSRFVSAGAAAGSRPALPRAPGGRPVPAPDGIPLPPELSLPARGPATQASGLATQVRRSRVLAPCRESQLKTGVCMQRVCPWAAQWAWACGRLQARAACPWRVPADVLAPGLNHGPRRHAAGLQRGAAARRPASWAARSWAWPA